MTKLKFKILFFCRVSHNGYFKFAGRWWMKKDKYHGTLLASIKADGTGKGQRFEAKKIVGIDGHSKPLY